MKDNKAVNYNGSEIIGSIHLKYGKRTASREFFFRECGISPKSREKVNNGVLIPTCLGILKFRGGDDTHVSFCKTFMCLHF